MFEIRYSEDTLLGKKGDMRMWGKRICLMVLFLGLSSSALSADLDGDGLDDDWEQDMFGSLSKENGSGDPEEAKAEKI